MIPVPTSIAPEPLEGDPRMPEERLKETQVPGHYCVCRCSPLRHDRHGCMDCSCDTFERIEQASRGQGLDCPACTGEEKGKKGRKHREWCPRYNPQ